MSLPTPFDMLRKTAKLFKHLLFIVLAILLMVPAAQALMLVLGFVALLMHRWITGFVLLATGTVAAVFKKQFN